MSHLAGMILSHGDYPVHIGIGNGMRRDEERGGRIAGLCDRRVTKSEPKRARLFSLREKRGVFLSDCFVALPVRLRRMAQCPQRNPPAAKSTPRHIRPVCGTGTSGSSGAVSYTNGLTRPIKRSSSEPPWLRPAGKPTPDEPEARCSGAVPSIWATAPHKERPLLVG